jgi:hypothetical protein
MRVVLGSLMTVRQRGNAARLFMLNEEIQRVSLITARVYTLDTL